LPFGNKKEAQTTGEAQHHPAATDMIRIAPKTKKAVIRYPGDYQIYHLCRMCCPVDAITITPDKSIPVIVVGG
jgi:hypothetical protein